MGRQGIELSRHIVHVTTSVGHTQVVIQRGFNHAVIIRCNVRIPFPDEYALTLRLLGRESKVFSTRTWDAGSTGALAAEGATRL